MINDSLHPEYPSPDTKHTLQLSYEHELRHGPAIFRLNLDGFDLGERVFWDQVVWSQDSRYVAVPESVGRYDTHGQDYWMFNRLIVFDLQTRDEATVSDYAEGWLVPVRFEGNSLLYYKEPQAGLRYEFERDCQTLSTREGWNDRVKLAHMARK